MPYEKLIADELECVSAEDLLDRLCRRSNLWQPDPAEWIFRGVSDLGHALTPSAYREKAFDDFKFDLIATDTPVDPSKVGACSDIGWRERTLLENFREKANERGLEAPRPLPDVRPRTAISIWDMYPDAYPLWALARHHGIPTSLLDWSRKPLVSAYFAAIGSAQRNKAGGKLAIWALRFPPNQKTRTVLPHWNDLYFYEAPNSSNPNLQAQAGLFTILYTNPMQTVDEYIRTHENDVRGNIDLEAPLMQLITLPQDHSRRLLRLLSEEGYDGSSMFPGYDGVTKYLREQNLYE